MSILFVSVFLKLSLAQEELLWSYCILLEITLQPCKILEMFLIQCFISAINKAVNYIDIQSEFGHWVLSKMGRVEAQRSEFGLQLMST